MKDYVLPKPKLPQQNWNDLVLEPNFKSDIEESIIQPVKEGKFPEEYSFILFGPPGTGKSSIPEAIANELDWSYFYIGPSAFFLKNGSVEYAITKCFKDIDNKTESLYKTNSKADPKRGADCVIVFDEIDELVISRDNGSDRSSRLLTTMMLPLFNELRQQAKNRRFIFFAITNHIRRFDPAIKRSGRFDLILPVGPPNRVARYLAFEKWVDHYYKKNLKQGVNIPYFIDEGIDREELIDFNMISLASDRLGFGEIRDICNKIFEQMKLSYKDAIRGIEGDRSKGIDTSIDITGLETSIFLRWINKQRNSNRDLQGEIDRYYEEYALYSRGSLPTSEPEQLQGRIQREVNALNIKDGFTNEKEEEYIFEFRNLSETNSFKGKITIGVEIDSQKYLQQPLSLNTDLIYPGEKFRPRQFKTVTVKSKIKIEYQASGNFLVAGVPLSNCDAPELSASLKLSKEYYIKQPKTLKLSIF